MQNPKCSNKIKFTLTTWVVATGQVQILLWFAVDEIPRANISLTFNLVH